MFVSGCASWIPLRPRKSARMNRSGMNITPLLSEDNSEAWNFLPVLWRVISVTTDSGVAK